MPAPYQQTVKATDAASSLGNAQAIVANVRTAVTACQQQYTQLKGLGDQGERVPGRAGAGQAGSTAGQETGAQRPPQPGPAAAQGRGDVPASTAFGIAASALVPAPGHS